MRSDIGFEHSKTNLELRPSLTDAKIPDWPLTILSRAEAKAATAESFEVGENLKPSMNLQVVLESVTAS